MRQDAPEQGLYTAANDPRLSFLASRNGQLTVPCRLPGCREMVKRKHGAGRTKWFHDESCSRKFGHRRRLLQTVAEELAARWENGEGTYRERQALEWELRWVLGVRASYVGPNDWLDSALESSGPSPSPALVRFADQCRRRRVEHKVRKDPCPVCAGTGDFRRYLPTVSADALDVLKKRRALRAQAVRVVVELQRFALTRGNMPTLQWADDAYHYAAGMIPGFAELLEAAQVERAEAAAHSEDL